MTLNIVLKINRVQNTSVEKVCVDFHKNLILKTFRYEKHISYHFQVHSDLKLNRFLKNGVEDNCDNTHQNLLRTLTFTLETTFITDGRIKV